MGIAWPGDGASGHVTMLPTRQEEKGFVEIGGARLGFWLLRLRESDLRAADFGTNFPGSREGAYT